MYTIHQAKSRLSRLIKQAENGAEVIIARGKTPVARLVAIGRGQKQRAPGKFKGRIKIGRSFFKPMTAAELKQCGVE
jgi:antitoxin (DNA-binding transcriptional repressor) of toxin-antitoxin stability system